MTYLETIQEQHPSLQVLDKVCDRCGFPRVELPFWSPLETLERLEFCLQCEGLEMAIGAARAIIVKMYGQAPVEG